MEKPLTQNIDPSRGPLDYQGYVRAGGYQGLRKALELEPKKVTEMVKESNLRGRGGAGFPAGMKWSFVPMGEDAPRPKYVVVNADEMEPGTFKDRLLLEEDPHQVIEGAAITAHAIEAEVIFLFLRSAYKLAEKRLERAIAEAYENGVLGPGALGSERRLDMYLHVSAGRYMCGEETGLLNALEGRRANPRAKPPFPGTSGVWGKPTVVQNVETLCNVPHILTHGSDWYMKLSKTKNGGTKLYGASGRVRHPGLWELPMGTTLGEVLMEHAGGMQDGYKFRGALPGGASTDFLVEEHLDVKLDFDETQKAGSRLGTGTIIVLDDRTCPVGMVWNLERFFAQESCGWCTPCWSGLSWTEKILGAMEQGRGESGHLLRLDSMTKFMGIGHTFCALAPGAVEPLQSALKYFRDDFQRHIDDQRCPWRDA